MGISYERDTMNDEERERIWRRDLDLREFRMRMAEQSPDARAVVNAIVAASPRAVTTAEIAAAAGVAVERVPGLLAVAHAVAAKIHRQPHKSGAVPWNLPFDKSEPVEHWTYQCPERVAKVLR